MKPRTYQRWNYLSKKSIWLFLLVVLWTFDSYAQKRISPDLSKTVKSKFWTVINREISLNNKEVYLNGKKGAGILYLNDFLFGNGKVEFDVKGKDEFQKSFVGIAFHIQNDSTYDAVYFRPFNFKVPGKEGRSVQYISIPGYDWPELREKFPGKYENKVQPVPEPTEWFHVAVEVKYPLIKVFINYSPIPSLVVEQLTARKIGKIGFWVGNGSDGYFRNLKLVKN
ncbi:family 16 glycoside hydrolase [Daejeonella sp.]|uniref:family 16 glycoside hydrolase n=1 Tax=Daejeonella sp. TaxID=2805397 RepID=UPI0030C28722